MTHDTFEILKHPTMCKHPDGTAEPVYVYGVECGTPQALALYEKLSQPWTDWRTGITHNQTCK